MGTKREELWQAIHKAFESGRITMEPGIAEWFYCSQDPAPGPNQCDDCGNEIECETCEANQPPAYVCGECGCPDVQRTAWLFYNTGNENVGCSPPTDQTYCPDCDSDSCSVVPTIVYAESTNQTSDLLQKLGALIGMEPGQVTSPRAVADFIESDLMPRAQLKMLRELWATDFGSKAQDRKLEALLRELSAKLGPAFTMQDADETGPKARLMKSAAEARSAKVDLETARKVTEVDQ